jgi:hypothetical protein
MFPGTTSGGELVPLDRQISGVSGEESNLSDGSSLLTTPTTVGTPGALGKVRAHARNFKRTNDE